MRTTISSISKETFQKVIEITELRIKILLRQIEADFEKLLNWVKIVFIIFKMSDGYPKLKK